MTKQNIKLSEFFYSLAEYLSINDENYEIKENIHYDLTIDFAIKDNKIVGPKLSLMEDPVIFSTKKNRK